MSEIKASRIEYLGSVMEMHGPNGCCTDCYGRTPKPAARAAGDRAQQLALDAHPDDRAKVEAAIRRLAATGRPFSANDARALHGVKGGVVGAAFTALRKARVIEPCGDDTSDEPGTHGHRVYLWRAVA